MRYALDDIARIIGSPSKVEDKGIEFIVLDSRKIHSPANSLFFALKGTRRDGHIFIPELYEKGIRSFVVSTQPDPNAYSEASFIVVDDTLAALQKLAAYHRSQFNIPVIGITGSNGKTIVKEWLYQLLHTDFHIVRSPKSYNSQIGVPLSVWQLNKEHNLAIFEAGISKPGEMERLQSMIRPTIGVFTNIGLAHNEGFRNTGEKVKEKLELFNDPGTTVIYSADHPLIDEIAKHFPFTPHKWSVNDDSAAVKVEQITKHTGSTMIRVQGKVSKFEFSIPFVDDASVENAITCCAVMLYLGVEPRIIISRMENLQPVDMRLELKKGINHCNIINDSYSADLSSLDIALNFLSQQNPGTKKTIILSDLLQSGLRDEELYTTVFESVKKHSVSRVVGIGERIYKALNPVKNHADDVRVELYNSTESFISQFRSSQFREETILVKGARIFGFERIVQLLELKAHQTILEINLNSIAHNMKVYQDHLSPSTRVMAMVKAFAYGSGGAEIAGILQYHKVDYLGVAYADEGVDLRKAGIRLPIMVMNPEISAFDALIEYNLEPDIYSFGLLHAFDKFLQDEGLQQYPVHIEIETGMNRLGFGPDEVESLGQFLRSAVTVKVQTVFSHLAASEDPKEDEFTIKQFTRFEQAVAILKSKLPYSFLQHIANSGAVFRLPQLQLDMVRLGIGLYGVDSGNTHQDKLVPVATLRSTIAQIKNLKPGETVSYNRKGVIRQDARIATVRIGYADGYSRRFGNGVGQMWVKGELAPVIGTVCMDMTMIDITGIDGVEEGDEVIIFGKELLVQQLADWSKTIAYEVMTGISQRVKRVYFEE